MVMLVSMMDIFRIQTILVSSLSQSAKELGMYAYSIDGESRSPVGAVTDGGMYCLCLSGGSEESKRREPHGNCGKTGRDYTAGVIIQGWHRNIESKLSVQKPVSLFPVFPVKIEAAAAAQAWLGYNGDKYGNTDDSPGGRCICDRL